MARIALGALSTAMVTAGGAPARAQAQSKPPELGSVAVTDTAIDQQEAEASYKVSRTVSGTRTDTPLIDVPQSVTVVLSV